MMPQSLDTLRVGHRYRMVNHGEIHRFILLEIREEKDYIIQDLETLDTYSLNDLIKYGIGRDYDLFEIGSE